MSHEQLAALIAAHQDALRTDPETRTTHEAIINLVQGFDTGDLTRGQCVRLLLYQALMVAEAPAHAALYRQAAANIRHRQLDR